MAKRTRAELKAAFQRTIKVLPAGPSNVTRGRNLLSELNDLADSALLEEDLVPLLLIDGGGPAFKGPRTRNPYI